MYITTKKGKRFFYNLLRNGNVDTSIEANWPNDKNCSIWDVIKSRPNIVENERKWQCKAAFFKAEVINRLIITKQDILELIDKFTYSGFADTMYISNLDILVETYNSKNNTNIKYQTYGNDYNKLKHSLEFYAINNKDYSGIYALPDDWTTSIEVYKIEDFSPITEYTDAEKKAMDKYRKEDGNQSIFDTFLKQSVEQIMDEFGLYYNEHYKAFRFKGVKEFREFLVKAINEIIVKKLNDNNIDCLQIRDLINVRSVKIEPETINIIKSCDLTTFDEETNNE